MYFLDRIFQRNKTSTHSKLEIQKDFGDWLNKILLLEISEEIIAFNFNIFEGIDNYQIQLVGSTVFSEEDSDWACNEDFSTQENRFIFDSKIVHQEWKESLSFIKEMIIKYLNDGELNSILKSRMAVSVGFIDGDLEIIFKKA